MPLWGAEEGAARQTDLDDEQSSEARESLQPSRASLRHLVIRLQSCAASARENGCSSGVSSGRAAGQVTIDSRETILKGKMVKHCSGWHVVPLVNPLSVTVALDRNNTIRVDEVDHADGQGHYTATQVDAARAAEAEKAAASDAAAAS